MKSDIKWTQDAIAAHVKILLGIWASRIWYETGSFPKNFRTDNSNNSAYQLIWDLMPEGAKQLSDQLSKTCSNKTQRTIQFRIGSRAKACMIGGYGGREIKTFMHPKFSNSFDLMQSTLDKNKLLLNEEIYHAQAKDLLLNTVEGPGIYFRIDPYVMERLKVGQSQNLLERKGEGEYILYRVYPTQNHESARFLEILFINAFQNHPLLLHTRTKSRGQFQFQQNVNAKDIIDETINANRAIQEALRIFFNNKNSIDSNAAPKEPPKLFTSSGIIIPIDGDQS